MNRQERQHEFWNPLQSAFMSASGEEPLWELLRRPEMADDLKRDTEAFFSLCLGTMYGSWVTGLDFMGNY